MDKARFTAAARQYQNMVYRTALHALGSPQDADDAVQEVFLRLFRYKEPFAGEEHLRRWLLRVTVPGGHGPAGEVPDGAEPLLLRGAQRPGDRGAAGRGGFHGDHPAGPGEAAAEGTIGGGLAG